MNYNDWAKEIHENAVKHGWSISRHEYAVLFHSEISAAFEEYRKGMPDVYWNYAPASDQEPHGIAIELIDLAIWLLDYAYVKGYDIDAARLVHIIDPTECSVAMINDFHEAVYILTNGACGPSLVCAFIDAISCYCTSKGLDFETLLRLKHEYNKTHGGKRC